MSWQAAEHQSEQNEHSERGPRLRADVDLDLARWPDLFFVRLMI